MKIAQVAPVDYRVPPRRYGGTERVVNFLTEELVRRGHKVTLFASADSKTSARLNPVVPHPLREAHIFNSAPSTILEVSKVYSRESRFDVIHNNAYPDYLMFPAAAASKTPTLTTLNLPFTYQEKRVFRAYKHLPFVSISNSQKKNAPELNYVATIHHGIPVQKFPFNNKRGNYLLFVGRISPQKGIHTAINVALKLGLKLVIAAKLDPYEVEYFNEKVAPRLDENGKIKWLGEVDTQERNKLMAGAMCLLNPINWPEPFGLVMIEAMATGCPVIAFNKGSVPEIVVDKKTGYIVRSEQEMEKAIKKIDEIDPKDCREHVKENFSVKKMVDAYEKLYLNLANNKKGR